MAGGQLPHVLAKALPKFLHKVSPNVRWAHTIPDSKYILKDERLLINYIFIILLIVMINILFLVDISKLKEVYNTSENLNSCPPSVQQPLTYVLCTY